jgi:hypothetical protein
MQTFGWRTGPKALKNQLEIKWIRIVRKREKRKNVPMRVNLLLILLLETKDDLNGDDSSFRALDLEIGSDVDLGGVFVDVRRDWFPVDYVLCYTVLVYAHCGYCGERSGIDLWTTVGHDAYHDLVCGGEFSWDDM